jgi:serine/threonine protein phosphatase PrpC
MAGESERILSMNGRIDYFKDHEGKKMGPARVYSKDDDGPGLAMSRSLGDTIAERLGVIAIPDVKVYKRCAEKDRAVVICSDGVTEFLSNDRIGDIIFPFYATNDTEGACRKLVEESTLRWMKEDNVIDDITAVVIFFH